MELKGHDINDLIYLMQRLRDRETGCPWDLQQTFSSIVPHTVEEVFEVVDAIERNDWPNLQEELGDLLFQIIFYSQLGSEEAYFDWSDVVNDIVSKLLRRHPHVFPDGTLNSKPLPGETMDEDTVIANWERIKASEKAEKDEDSPGIASRFEDIPHALPALLRAQKIQQKAASSGFDWAEVTPVIAKVREEVSELEQALKDSADQNHLQEEMGDLLFSCVNLSRFLALDPETSLRGANQKFEYRFNRMEAIVRETGATLGDIGLVEMDRIWELVKKEARD